MAFSEEQRRRIFDRTAGRCHICGGGLTFAHYGRLDASTGWEVEHSVPKAAGGTDHGNNLYAAHSSCNRSKGAGSTQAARAVHGRTRAPLSAEKRQQAQQKNTGVGLGVGIAVGSAIGGPPGAVIGGLIGAALGGSVDPE